ncbi:hypothetical protein ACFL3M_02830, partial [Patescibacteria group bacterium]
SLAAREESRDQFEVLSANLDDMMKGEERIKTSFADQTMTLIKSAKELGLKVAGFERLTTEEEIRISEAENAVTAAENAVEKIKRGELGILQRFRNKVKLLDEAKQELENAERVRDEVNAAVQKALSQRLEKASIKDSSDALLVSGEDTITQIEAKIGTVTGIIDTLTTHENDLQENIEIFTGEYENLSTLVESLDQDVEDMQAELDSMSNTTSAEYEKAKGDLREKEKERKAAVDERTEKFGQLTTSKEMLMSAQASVIAQEEYLSTYNTAKSQLEITIRELVPQFDSQLELARGRKLLSFVDDISKIGAQRTLELSRDAAKSGHAAVKSMAERLEGAPERHRDLADVLNEQKKGSESIVARIDQILDEYAEEFSEATE